MLMILVSYLCQKVPEAKVEEAPTVEIGVKDGEINLAFTPTEGKYERTGSISNVPFPKERF